MTSSSSAEDVHSWLSLVTQHGLFVSDPVLNTAFAKGVDSVSPESFREFKREFDLFSIYSEKEDTAKFTRWINYILEDFLGFSKSQWCKHPNVSDDVKHFLFEYEQWLSPDRVLLSNEGKPLLLVKIVKNGQSLERPEKEKGTWKASPYFKLTTLCLEKNIPLALLSNGVEFRLIHVKPTTGTSYFEWKARDCYEEKSLLDSFYTFLNKDRFFGVEDKRLLHLIDESQKRQLDVTDQLGKQMHQALEIFVRAIGNLKQSDLQELFANATGEYIYEMSLTFMMRLVFLLYAEENGLLPHGNFVYENNYGISHLVYQLQSRANNDEYMNKKDAWPRILSLFRLIYSGCGHPDVKSIAYDSELFDPERFPELEHPDLVLDNKTIWKFLHNLCYAETKIGRDRVKQKVSYHTIDVEQIGSVYESLIGFSVERASEKMVVFNTGENTIRPVSEFIDLDNDALVDYLKSVTGKTEESIRKSLERNDESVEFLNKIESFIVEDGIIEKGQLYISRAGSIRKSSGTYYTPKEITRFLVQEALEPLVYEETDKGKKIKNPRKILDLNVCDPAMGSGAFLVQAIRYLSERLVESWTKINSETDDNITLPYGEISHGADNEELLPSDETETLQRAKLYVAQNCIYGVDKNQMAVELAKVSIWLTTMCKDRPLTFLDHRLKCGDSLIGTDFEHISKIPDEPLWKEDKKFNHAALNYKSLMGINFEDYFKDILTLRKNLKRPELTIYDIKHKAKQYKEAHTEDKPVSKLKDVFDLWTSIWFWPYDEEKKNNKKENIKTCKTTLFSTDGENNWVNNSVNEDNDNYLKLNNRIVEIIPPLHTAKYHEIALKLLDLNNEFNSNYRLKEYREIFRNACNSHQFFHWELEFPEVFLNENGTLKENPGFNLIIGNPPWDKVLPDKRRFLMNYYGNISLYDSEKRKEIEDKLLKNKEIKSGLDKYIKKIHQFSAFIKYGDIYNNQFPRSKTGEVAGGGHTDSFLLFLERNFLISSNNGYIANVLPGAFTGDLRGFQIRKMLLENGVFKGLWRIQNRAEDIFLFPNVAAQAKICLINYEKGKKTYNNIKECKNLNDLNSKFDRYQRLLSDDVKLFSPNNLELQFFNSIQEFSIGKKIIIYPNLSSIKKWKIDTSQEINITHDRNSITNNVTSIPLWEGSLTFQFKICSQPKKYIIPNTITSLRLQDSQHYRLAIRTILSNGPKKIQASIVPKGFLLANSLNYIVPNPDRDYRVELYLLSLINSYVIEYNLLTIISGYNLNNYRIRQLPIPYVNDNNYFFNQLVPRASRLVCTREEFSDLWSDVYNSNWKNLSVSNGGSSLIEDWDKINKDWNKNCGIYGGEEDNKDRGNRALIRAEIDALIAHLYSLNYDEFEYILNSFEVLKRMEQKELGEFFSKNICLKQYERLKTIVEEEKKKHPEQFEIKTIGE